MNRFTRQRRFSLCFLLRVFLFVRYQSKGGYGWITISHHTEQYHSLSGLPHAVIQSTSQHTDKSLNITRVGYSRNCILKVLSFNLSCSLAGKVLIFLKKTMQQHWSTKYQLPSAVKTMLSLPVTAET